MADKLDLDGLEAMIGGHHAAGFSVLAKDLRALIKAARQRDALLEAANSLKPYVETQLIPNCEIQPLLAVVLSCEEG
jgi:hypothetical protein